MLTKSGNVPGIKPESELAFDSYLHKVREGHWQDIVLAVRTGKAAKMDAPGVTPSGSFSHRSGAGLKRHSGFIALDLDRKDNEWIGMDEICADPYTYAAHKSISGEGVVVYVKIQPERHAEAFLALEKYYADKYQLILDPSGKDITRFRFVSYDPELWMNAGSKTWKTYLKKNQVQPVGRTYVHSVSDVEHVLNQISYKRVNLADSYHDWIKVGMAFASRYGEQGRDYFHQVSSMSSKYDRDGTDRKYTALVRGANKAVGIASFFWLAQQHGLEIKTPRTAHVVQAASMQKKAIGTSGGAPDVQSAKEAVIKLLSDVDNMSGEEVEDLVEQVFQANDADLEAGGEVDILKQVKEFLRIQDIRFNLVSGKNEIKGRDMTDREYNSLYINMLEVVNPMKQKKAVSKDLFYSLIDSDFTQEFHPLHDFFAQHAEMKPKGVIDELISCMKMKPLQITQGEFFQPEAYLQTYFRKWLLSCIASWHGTYSVMMVVLTGKQYISKTNFLRYLLPDELGRYYAESKLDKGKDDEILMCTKALICDDEYSGKSKVEYKMLKELLSKQVFTVRRPYGRMAEDLQRIAVLCGTSNEDEIINDPTGNRRIIPVPLLEIDWERYRQINKTLLWMELYHEWLKSGDSWMLTRQEIEYLQKLTIEYNQVSQEEEAVLMFFGLPSEGGYCDYLTNTEIRNEIEMNTRLKLSQVKLGVVLQKLGFRKIPKKIDGTTRLVYEVVKKRSNPNPYGNPTPAPF